MLHSLISSTLTKKNTTNKPLSNNQSVKSKLHNTSSYQPIFTAMLLAGSLSVPTAYAENTYTETSTQANNKQGNLLSSIPFFGKPSNHVYRRPPTLEEIQIREFIPQNKPTGSTPEAIIDNTNTSQARKIVDPLTSSSFGYGQAPIVPFDKTLTEQLLNTNLKIARSNAIEEILEEQTSPFSVLNTTQPNIPTFKEPSAQPSLTIIEPEVITTSGKVDPKQTESVITNPATLELKSSQNDLSEETDQLKTQVESTTDTKKTDSGQIKEASSLSSIASDSHLSSVPSEYEIHSEKTQIHKADEVQKDEKPGEEKTTDSKTDKPVVRPPMVTPPPHAVDTQKALLEGARQSSSKPRTAKAPTNPESNVPAFSKLMDKGVEQLKNNQINQAEASFTRAQRLIPQSSAVYFYLGQVALKKNQPRKAQAFARRGLIVSDSNTRKRSLWQVILKSAQMSGDDKTINEAKQALQ